MLVPRMMFVHNSVDAHVHASTSDKELCRTTKAKGIHIPQTMPRQPCLSLPYGLIILPSPITLLLLAPRRPRPATACIPILRPSCTAWATPLPRGCWSLTGGQIARALLACCTCACCKIIILLRLVELLRGRELRRQAARLHAWRGVRVGRCARMGVMCCVMPHTAVSPSVIHPALLCLLHTAAASLRRVYSSPHPLVRAA